MTQQLPPGYQIQLDQIGPHAGEIASAFFTVVDPLGQPRRVEVRATDWMLDIFLKESGRRDLSGEEEERLLAEAGQRVIADELRAGRQVGPVVRFNSRVFEDQEEVRGILGACGLPVAKGREEQPT